MGKEAATVGKAIRKEVEGSRDERKETLRPAGKVPTATVLARHDTGTVSRMGRGFSFGELSEAGLEPRLAARWGVWVDVRRRSVLGENVSTLRGWHTHRGPTAKLESEAKSAGKELKTVGREMEEAAVVIERVPAKIEREVKKETKKVGKTVKKKAKPRAKPKKG